MKFLVPAAKDAAQAEEIFEGIRKFNAEQMDATLSARDAFIAFREFMMVRHSRRP